MAEVFVGQIMMTGFGFPPKGFAQCNGQLLPINQNQALFSLLGTYYGGNGTNNFALPNLQGATPNGFGGSSDPTWQPSPMALGEFGGSENVTLTIPNLPSHNHSVNVINNVAGSPKAQPAGSVLGQTPTGNIYGSPNSGPLPLDPSVLSPVGGSQPHPNMQPFAVINFNIALTGYFPSRG